jgi:uncharacterized protein YkwD
MRPVSKTVNPGSNPGSPASFPHPATLSVMARERRAHGGVAATFVLLAAALLIAFAAAPGTTAALAACPHENARPHTTSLAKLRTAMRCLVNKQRAKRHLTKLKSNTKLAGAAQRHTKVMLRKDCFKHHCPGEVGLRKRMKRSGYLKGAKSYYYAEDLGFDRTPKRMIRRLMSDPYNRGNILNGDFRDIGVGAGWGAPKKARDDRKYACLKRAAAPVPEPIIGRRRAGEV